MAKKAVELSPNDGNIRNTLGVAYCRARQPKAAIEALNESTRLGNTQRSLDLFPRAMAHWQLGEKEKARDFYDRAVVWMEKNKPDNEELHQFRDEAAELLGLADTLPKQEEQPARTD